MRWTPYEMAVLCATAEAPTDQAVAFRDDFESGEGDVEDRGWSWYQENLVATQSITDGEINIEITAGGTEGSFWFDGNDGILLYKLITGDCDVRARIRVLNTDGDAPPPPTSNYRLVVLAAHDPDRSTVLNYCHVGAGSTAQADNRVEWKTTDDSVSTFGDNGSGITTPIAVDVRIVRLGQSFQPYWRETTGDLSSNTGWTALQEMDRSDNQTPVRDSAVALPDTLQWGIAVYSNQATHDVQGFIGETWATR